MPWTLMPRPTTSVRRSVGSRGAERPRVTAGRTGATGVVGVVGAGENGGRDMICASLSGAGRKGGTPRPLSNGVWGAVVGEACQSESDCTAFEASGTDGGPAGSGLSIVLEAGSSGLRRLNKTLYQTENGAFAYHGVRLTNNILFLSSGSIRFQIERRPALSAAVKAMSRTWTMAATPMIGMNRFMIGIYAASARMAPWARTMPRFARYSDSAIARGIRRMATATNSPRPIA